MSISNKYLNALKKRYEAEMAEAEANLSLYFSNNNLAAIGEHSDLMDEHDKWIDKYTNAKDKLETLNILNLNDDNMQKINDWRHEKFIELEGKHIIDIPMVDWNNYPVKIQEAFDGIKFINRKIKDEDLFKRVSKQNIQIFACVCVCVCVLL
jgi:hypothetical protein